MANQRLELVNKNIDIQYSSGSPLLLEATALYLDTITNNCIAQLKWKNIDSRTVNAVMVELDGYDTFDQKIELVNYQYVGLLASQGSEFGNKTPIIMNNNKVVRFEVIIQAVSFSDKSIWRSDSLQPLEALPVNKKQSIEGELLEQFERDLAQKGKKSTASFDPQNALGLWQCGCGSWQYNSEKCLNCGISQAELSKISDKHLLMQHLTDRKEQEEKRRIEAERKRIVEEERAKEEQIVKSFDEIFRAASYLLDRLDPAYADAINMYDEINDSRFGKKVKAKNAIPVFQKVVSCTKEPISAIKENLPMALQRQDTYPQEVYDAYLLLQKALDEHILQLNLIIQNIKDEGTEKKRNLSVISKQYKDKINIVRIKTDEIR